MSHAEKIGIGWNPGHTPTQFKIFLAQHSEYGGMYTRRKYQIETKLESSGRKNRI